MTTTLQVPEKPATDGSIALSAPLAAPTLPAWVVRKANRPNLLEEELMRLHAEGFFIYKVLCNAATGDYVVIAKPRRHYNGKLKELNRIRKAITAFVEMMKRADQS